MSKDLIERESLENIARKIKLKTDNTEKMTAAGMPDRIGTLHGYRSNARVLSSDPVSFPLSVFELTDAGAAMSASAENNVAPRRKLQTAFSIVSLSFSTTAAEAE